MRKTLLILFLIIKTAQAYNQTVEPFLIGNQHWKKVEKQLGPTELLVTKHVFKINKTTTLNNSNTISRLKIDPKGILIHNGPTTPVKQSIKHIGKKLTAPIAIKASPLIIRDNAAFNISYSNKQNGFPGNFTYDFAEDDQHNMWIAADNGLYKYDGYNYYLYNKKNGVPIMSNASILFDQKKRLWIASDSGVYYIQNDSLFALRNENLDFAKVPSFKVQSDRFNHIWVSTKKNGAICIDESSIQIYDTRCGLLTNNITSTLIDKNGTIFLGATDLGLYVIEANKMRLLFKDSKNMAVHSILSLYEDEDGVWAGGFLSGFLLLGKKDTLQYSISGKYNERIFDIKKAPGGLWLASYSSELCYFDKKQMLLINEKNGLINRFPYFLFEDSYHNVWVSNPESGFSRVNENALYIKEHNNKAIGNIKKIIPDNKMGIWIITHGKNLVYQKGNAAISYIAKEKNGTEPFSFLMDGILNKDGSLWLGNYGGGLTLATDKSYTSYFYSSFPADGIITSVKEDFQEKVWFSPTNFGLIFYDKNKFWKYNQPAGLLSNNVKHVFLDGEKRANWTFESGLQRINNNKIETFFIDDKLVDYQVNGILPLGKNKSILATDEVGLLLLDNNKVYRFSTAEGLNNNNIKTIIKDVYNTIWISTDKGIESFKMNGINLTDHKIFNSINGNYILDAENVFLNASGLPNWVVKDKTIIYDPRFSTVQQNPPVFSFKKISIDNKLAEKNDLMSVFPNQEIGIDYTSIYWGRENNLIHQYLLISERGDTVFNSIGNLGHISLSDIFPSKYQLIISAKDNQKTYYSTPIFIRINNFWYNTLIFRIAIFLLLLLILISLFQQKAKRQLKINNRLNEMVEEQTIELEKEKKELIDSYQIINKQNEEKDILIQEINHRVKNNLQFILAMVEMQMDKNETTGPLISTARRITAMSLVHEMLYDNKEVQVLPLKKYVSELIKNFSDLASNMENPVEIKLEIADLIISAKTAISLGIIISELVSNSFKHAFKDIELPTITIQISPIEKTNQMVLTISDNGNGMNGDCLSSNGFGMKMIDIFSRQLEGEYSIDCNNHFIYTLTFNN